MKRFIKFLAEAEAPQPATPTPDAAPISPTSMPNPFWFGTSPAQQKPYTPLVQPENEPQSPSDIDWQDLDERIREVMDEYEQLIRMMENMSVEEILKFMREKFGIGVDRIEDLFFFLEDHYFKKINKYFHKQYFRNASPQQKRTYTEKMKQFNKMLEKLFRDWYNRRHNTPTA